MKTTALLTCLLGFALCAHGAAPTAVGQSGPISGMPVVKPASAAAAKEEPKPATVFTFKGIPMGISMVDFAKTAGPEVYYDMSFIEDERPRVWLQTENLSYAEKHADVTLIFEPQREGAVAKLAERSHPGARKFPEMVGDSPQHRSAGASLTLESILVRFSSEDFDDIAKTMAIKYGPPKIKTEAVSTKLGLKLTNTWHDWRFGETFVSLEKYSSSIDKSALFVHTKKSLDAFDASRAGANAKAVKDL